MSNLLDRLTSPEAKAEDAAPKRSRYKVINHAPHDIELPPLKSPKGDLPALRFLAKEKRDFPQDYMAEIERCADLGLRPGLVKAFKHYVTFVPPIGSFPYHQAEFWVKGKPLLEILDEGDPRF